MILYETLNKMTVAQLKDTKDMIDIIVKNKVKMIKNNMTYRVPMAMLEVQKY